jgi:hypothetical protein
MEGSGPRLEGWLSGQREAFNGFVAQMPGDEAGIRAKLGHKLSYDWRGIPIPKGGRYFFHRRPPGEDRISLWGAESVGEGGWEIFHPRQFGQATGTAELGAFWPSPDGRHIVVSLFAGGSQAALLAVLAVDCEWHQSRIVRTIQTDGPSIAHG